MKKKFKPKEWLSTDVAGNVSHSNTPISSKSSVSLQSSISSTTADAVEIIKRIETKQLDITTTYTDWRDIGFAFASEFGEQGRNYFHQISRFYSDYSSSECDKQFDKCLKSNKSGITIKTFFQKAKEAGINIATQAKVSNGNNDVLPTIPQSVYDTLPVFLKDICSVTNTNHEKDILLLGSIVTLSSVVPNVFGVYDNRKVFSNLFLFITAQASAGKGMLNFCSRLVNPINQQLRDESLLLKIQYERDCKEFKKSKNDTIDKPKRPPELMLFIPANNSASGMLQLLHDNNCRGLIFETEGDTLAYAFKSDYGNYSDALRKAFHHEAIRFYRKTDREFIELQNPQLSTVLSGTPKQVINLIPDAENGLFSRFMFYCLEMKSGWKNVFERKSGNSFDEHFDKLGLQYYELFKSLKSSINIEFTLAPNQQDQFHKIFTHWHETYETMLGTEYNATVRRLGLISFRLAMVFSILRIFETSDISNRIVCTDVDFENAIAITELLLSHTQKVFSKLPLTITPQKRENREERFFNALPNTFSRKDYVGIAEKQGIPDKTAQNYIAKFIDKKLIHRDKQDFYSKTVT